MANTNPIYPVPDFAAPVECDRSCDAITYLPCGGPEEPVEEVLSCATYSGGAGPIDIDLTGEPSLVLSKADSDNRYWSICDTFRGNDRSWACNNNFTEQSLDPGTFTFQQNGYQIGNNSFDAINDGFNTYYSMHLKTGSGFSAVTYTGNGINREITHTLGAQPNMVWIRRLNPGGRGLVQDMFNPADISYRLDDGLRQSNTNFFNNTKATSTVISLGTNLETNQDGSEFIAYLFTTVAGKFICSTYTGTGVSGLQLPCDFVPNGILVKLISFSASGGGGWLICDKCMNPVNPAVNLFRFDLDTNIFQSGAYNFEFHTDYVQVNSTSYAANGTGLEYAYWIY